ncbi:MAG: hypothetical protein KatS3mg082_3284 [Nitrospiraceae bacterium]|nr:MAG: hypothetical protein KatS3mg082_3284 [Nitrospiraceae bacterium]
MTSRIASRTRSGGWLLFARADARQLLGQTPARRGEKEMPGAAGRVDHSDAEKERRPRLFPLAASSPLREPFG